MVLIQGKETCRAVRRKNKWNGNVKKRAWNELSVTLPPRCSWVQLCSEVLAAHHLQHIYQFQIRMYIYIYVYKFMYVYTNRYFNKCSTCLSERFLTRQEREQQRKDFREQKREEADAIHGWKMSVRWCWCEKKTQPDSMMLFHVMIFLAVWRIWFGIDIIYGDICWFYYISQKIPIISHLVVFVISAPICAFSCSFCQHGSVALVEEIVPSPVISPWIPDWSLIYQLYHHQILVKTHSWWLNLPIRTNQEGMLIDYPIQ